MKKTVTLFFSLVLCLSISSCIPPDSPTRGSFYEYKVMAEENRDFPVGVEVSIGNTPNGGVFSVAFFTDGDGVATSKDDATKVEIHECDENGVSIHRTYLNR